MLSKVSKKGHIAACELLFLNKRLLLNDINSLRTNVGSKRCLLTCNANSHSYNINRKQLTIQSQCQRGPLTGALRPIHTAEFVNFQKYVCIEFYMNSEYTMPSTRFSFAFFFFCCCCFNDLTRMNTLVVFK